MIITTIHVVISGMELSYTNLSDMYLEAHSSMCKYGIATLSLTSKQPSNQDFPHAHHASSCFQPLSHVKAALTTNSTSLCTNMQHLNLGN